MYVIYLRHRTTIVRQRTIIVRCRTITCTITSHTIVSHDSRRRSMSYIYNYIFTYCVNFTFSVDFASQLATFSHIEAFSHMRVPQLWFIGDQRMILASTTIFWPLFHILFSLASENKSGPYFFLFIQIYSLGLHLLYDMTYSITGHQPAPMAQRFEA